MKGYKFVTQSGRHAVVVSDRLQGRYHKYRVMFLDNMSVVTTSKRSIDAGTVVDKLERKYHGVGCVGYGKEITKGKIYSVWSSMLARCYNKRSKAYAGYGGRGCQCTPTLA